MTNAGKENKMGKLQTFLASAIIGLSPAGGGILNAQTAENGKDRKNRRFRQISRGGKACAAAARFF